MTGAPTDPLTDVKAMLFKALSKALLQVDEPVSIGFGFIAPKLEGSFRFGNAHFDSYMLAKMVDDHYAKESDIVKNLRAKLQATYEELAVLTANAVSA